MLFKNFDSKRSELSSVVGLNELKNFLNREGTPLVINYSEKYDFLIKKEHVPCLFIFYDSHSSDKGPLESIAKTVASKTKYSLQVVLVDAIKESSFADSLGFKDKLPYIRIADSRVKPKVYAYKEKELNAPKLIKFIESWETNKIKAKLS